MSTKPKPELRPASAVAKNPTATPSTPQVPAGSSVSPFPEDPRAAEVERRGPGRPPKLCASCGKSATECKCSKAAAPELSQDTVKKLLAGTFRTVGGAIAIATGVEMEVMQKIWTLAEGELILMGSQATDLANKYADDFLKMFQTEIAFAVTILPIVAVKAAVTRKVIAAHKAANPPVTKEAAPPSPNARDVGTRAVAA